MDDLLVRFSKTHKQGQFHRSKFLSMENLPVILFFLAIAAAAVWFLASLIRELIKILSFIIEATLTILAVGCIIYAFQVFDGATEKAMPPIEEYPPSQVEKELQKRDETTIPAYASKPHPSLPTIEIDGHRFQLLRKENVAPSCKFHRIKINGKEYFLEPG